MEEEEDMDGIEVYQSPIIEKPCVFCKKNSSHEVFKTDEYINLFIDHFVPPSGRILHNELKKFDCFVFCTNCEVILDELLQLNKALECILQNIKIKVQGIKCSILKTGKPWNNTDSNKTVNTFLKILTRDMYPVVKMTEKNILWTKTNPVKATQTEISPEWFLEKSFNSEIVKVEDKSDICFVNEDVTKFEPWNQLIDFPESDFSFECDYPCSNLITESKTLPLIPEENCTHVTEGSTTLLTDPLSESQLEDALSPPELNLSQMGILALANSKDVCGTKSSMFNFILENFPYYKISKNEFVYELYTNSLFKKVPEGDVRLIESSVSDLWTICDLESITLSKIIEVLQSPEVNRIMAFPGKRVEFVQKLLMIRNKASPHHSVQVDKMHSVDNLYNKQQPSVAVVKGVSVPSSSTWQKPPFMLSQIVFIALSNCSEKTATAGQIVGRIRSIFPYFLLNNPLKIWQTGLHSTLFVNKCFARLQVSRSYDVVTDKWVICEEGTAEMRNKIVEILACSEHPTSIYINKPDEVLKNALVDCYSVSLLNKSDLTNKNPMLTQLLSKTGETSTAKDLEQPRLENECSTSAFVHGCPRIANTKKWQRPPLNFAQIVFVALWNCPGRQANMIRIIDSVRHIFPYSNDPSINWERRLPAVLFYNQSFTRINAAEHESPNENHIWTINTATVNTMKHEIGQLFKNSGLHPTDYMNFQGGVDVFQNISITENNLQAKSTVESQRTTIYNTSGLSIAAVSVAENTVCSRIPEVQQPIEEPEVEIIGEVSTPVLYTRPNVVVEGDLESKTWICPPLNCSQLVCFVLATNPEYPISGFSICEILANLFPYFRSHRKALCESVLSTLCENENGYFIKMDNDESALSRFSLHSQNNEIMERMKLDVYSGLKHASVLYDSFFKPSGLHQMLKCVLGDAFDLSFLETITICS